LFRKKARHLVEEALIEIERHRSIQDSCKFCERLNDVRRQFEPQVAMCQERGTINQQKPSAGEMEITFSRTLERRKAPNRSNQHVQSI
jgi:hypothetical protein